MLNVTDLYFYVLADEHDHHQEHDGMHHSSEQGSKRALLLLHSIGPGQLCLPDHDGPLVFCRA